MGDSCFSRLRNCFKSPFGRFHITTPSLVVLCSLLLSIACSETTPALPLEDRSLRCCAVTASPYIERSDRRKANGFDGLGIEYLSLLRERTGFKCSELKEYEDPNGVGWQAFIDNLVNCTDEDGTIIKEPDCNCDIGIGAWWDTEDRIGVDFLPAYAYDGLTVLVSVEDTKTSTGGAFFITAFSWDVWVGILALFIIFSALKLLDIRFAPPEGEFVQLRGNTSRLQRLKYYLLKSRILYRLRRAMQSTFNKMTLQETIPIKGDQSSARQRTLNLVIILTGIFFILVYEASMTTMLVQETIVSEFSSIDDFKTCRIDDRDVCFVKGDATSSLWNTSILPSPCREKLKHYPSEYNSYETMLNAVSTRECKYAIVDDGTATTAVQGRYCQKLIKTGEPFFQGGVSFVVPKKSPLLWDLRKATLEIRTENALESKEEYVRRGGVCEVNTDARLDWNRLRLFFILSFAFCGVVLLEMIVDPQTSMRGIVEQERQVRESDANE